MLKYKCSVKKFDLAVIGGDTVQLFLPVKKYKILNRSPKNSHACVPLRVNMKGVMLERSFRVHYDIFKKTKNRMQRNFYNVHTFV